MTITLELTGMSPTGDAIGRQAGLVIFVPFGIPGDVIEAQVTHKRRTYAHAKVVRVLQPAPERITPPCRYFGFCGGCEWQHIRYNDQLKYKTQAVIEQFVRIGKIHNPPVNECIPCPTPYNYRNHTQFVRSHTGHAGYFVAGSNEVVEIEECPILQPELNYQLNSINLQRPDLQTLPK